MYTSQCWLIFMLISDPDLICTCTAAPNIRNMSQSSPVCSYKGLRAISQHCPDLKQLTLNETSYVVGVDEAISCIVTECRKLRKLNLIQCQHLTDTGLAAITAHCTQLEEFRITRNGRITEAPVMALLHARGANLRALSLSGCLNIRSVVIAAIATHCTMLRTLDISYLSIIGPAYLELVVRRLKNIVRLNASNWGVDNRMLQLITTHLPLIEDLSIRSHHKPSCSVDGLTQLVRGCEKLAVLDLGFPYDVSVLEQWQRVRPGLRVTTE